MTDLDRLEQRLSAVERVVVDGDAALDELAEVAALAETVADLETRVDEHERRLADLEAAVRSLEGYVGNVESINDDVERQAASAVATVDRLERRVDRLEVELDDVRGGVLREPTERETEGTRSGSDSDDGAGEGGAGSAFEFDDESIDGTDAADDPSESASLEFATGAGDDGTGAETAQTPEETVADIVAGSDEPRPREDAPSRGDRPAQPDDETDGDDAESGLFGSLRARFP
ncbi:DUF7310 family coiled-coil domain-containing protein [Halopiger xanaduensis]|uniref:DUF7310 domain-containing protein n=1 Tax=Halopiger xanaduensis (strain DSM 18323 / JCM 14033 / SH-6) TaxID=797210 RepID=F8D4U1_HALXS|nr:hypothetical protein [Halopiger xanaduensis]AEH37562.1 hypothetical protein Halxa_2946 [Halopiger xanaduensis SH-6]